MHIPSINKSFHEAETSHLSCVIIFKCVYNDCEMYFLRIMPISDTINPSPGTHVQPRAMSHLNHCQLGI